MADPYKRRVTRGPAGGMNGTPGTTGVNQVEFAANIDISAGRWETRRGYRAWPPATGDSSTIDDRFYADVCYEFRPRGRHPRYLIFGEDTATPRPAFCRLQHTGAAFQWNAISTVGVGQIATPPGAWSFAETPMGELVVADGSGYIGVFVPTQVAGVFARDDSFDVDEVAFSVGKGQNDDAFAYITVTPQFRAVRWWKDRLVGLGVPNLEGGGRLLAFSDTGGGRPGRPRGQFAFPAASNVTVPSNDGQRGVALGEANGRLLVGLDSSLWAATDDGMTVVETSGVSFRRVSGASGMVNPLAGCEVPRDGSDVWAYVARDGIYATDGIEAVRLTTRPRTDIRRFWDKYVLRGALKAARARCLSVARRVDFLLPVVSRGATKSGFRMALVSWHYDADEWVVRGWNFPPYGANDEDQYLNATALGVVRADGREKPWHATSSRTVAVSGRVYLDDVGWRDAARVGVAGTLPAFKVVTPRDHYGSGQTVRPREVILTLNEVGLVPVLCGALTNPGTAADYDALPTPDRQAVVLRANTPLWSGTGANAATYGGGQTWQPDAEVTRTVDVGESEGEYVQLVIDASAAGRVSIGAYDYRDQETGRTVQERHDGAD